MASLWLAAGMPRMSQQCCQKQHQAVTARCFDLNICLIASVYVRHLRVLPRVASILENYEMVSLNFTSSYMRSRSSAASLTDLSCVSWADSWSSTPMLRFSSTFLALNMPHKTHGQCGWIHNRRGWGETHGTKNITSWLGLETKCTLLATTLIIDSVPIWMVRGSNKR